MLLNVYLVIHRSGIPFVAVHDSYWAHGCNIDEMNKVIIIIIGVFLIFFLSLSLLF